MNDSYNNKQALKFLSKLHKEALKKIKRRGLDLIGGIVIPKEHLKDIITLTAGTQLEHLTYEIIKGTKK